MTESEILQLGQRWYSYLRGHCEDDTNDCRACGERHLSEGVRIARYLAALTPVRQLVDLVT